MPTHDPRDPDLAAFWRERHLCTLTTLRADGTPHVVPVGVTYDPETLTARVITGGGSAKVRHVERLDGEATVAVCQVDGGRWSTLEGRARITRDVDEVAEAVRRYAERYRQPRENPERVAIVIDVTRVLGSARLTPLPRD
ncbi:pyridoxamine 5'-phosphate oxidase family protein [Solicola sp. PLA-1-18]|uniref:pyridoxamine 5'-phosphate oxidase family protein n=1 Tax=Solicola sp. PLA-1-18 TaxID=3380532 RepID=UPI003B7BF8F6